MEEKTLVRLTELIKISGYLIASGAFIGFSAGIYLLFNREEFSFFVGISTYEATSYFLAVFIPSFVILIIIGYLFATTFGLKRANLLTVAPLCFLSIVGMVLSALSVFYLFSFLGGLLALTALIRAYTKPLFKRLYKTEAFFLVETGAMFVASFSILFLLMWLVSNFFATYGMGLYVSYSPYALTLVAVFSFLMFFTIPLWGSKGTSVGTCAGLGLTLTILAYVFVVQNQYVFVNVSAYIGVLMLVVGFALALVGNLTYVKLFVSEPVELSIIPDGEILHQGEYCPYCGKPRVTAVQNLCTFCGRSLMWTPYAPFCSSCGRLVPSNAQICSHCHDDIRTKRIYFNLREAREQEIAHKVVVESSKRKSWITKGFMRISRTLRETGRFFWGNNGLFGVIQRRLSLTLKEVVFIVILTYLFVFFSFVGYVKVVPTKAGTRDLFILNYGLPLGWLQVSWFRRPLPYVHDVNVLWIPLIFDVTLYFIASLGLVYGVARLRR